MDFSDLSDLTDISSDDDQLTQKGGKGKSKSKSKSRTTNNGYVLKNALKAPRNVQYSAKFLYEQVVDNRIDLNPEYQREIVWPESKQSGLIDSVLRNYYVPPVIFSVNVHDDGTETRTCIDGKQRLTSIQRFFDGMICHKDSFTNQKLWFKNSGRGTNRKLLPPQYRTHFESKQITCIEYENLTDDQEREMFQRVQLGVALTPAERLQAITGPFPTLIREVQNMISSDNGFGNNLEWSSTRGRDFQCIASVVYLIHKIPAQSFPTSVALDKWLQSNMPVEPNLRTAVTETFRRFISLVRNPQYNAPFNKPTRVSPLEFVMIGLLIFILRAKCTDEEISERIRDMRVDVRSKHVDIRSNTKVTKTMFAFINLYAKSGWVKTTVSAPSPAAGRKKGKRKRDEGSEDDHDEDAHEVRKPPPPIAITGRQTRVAAEAAAFSHTFPSPTTKKTPASKARGPTESKKTSTTVVKRESRSPAGLSTSTSSYKTKDSQSLRGTTTEEKPGSSSTYQATQTGQQVVKTETTDFFAAIREAKAQKTKVITGVNSPNIPGQSGVAEEGRNIAAGQIVSAAAQAVPAPSATFRSLVIGDQRGKPSSTLQRHAIVNSSQQARYRNHGESSIYRQSAGSASEPATPATLRVFTKAEMTLENNKMMNNHPTRRALEKKPGPSDPSPLTTGDGNTAGLSRDVVPEYKSSVPPPQYLQQPRPPQYSPPPVPPGPGIDQLRLESDNSRIEEARQYRSFQPQPRLYNKAYSMESIPRGPRYNSGGYYGRDRDRGWRGRR